VIAAGSRQAFAAHSTKGPYPVATTALFTNTNGTITLSNGENYFLGEGVTHYRTTNGTILSVTGTNTSNTAIVVNRSIAQLTLGEAINVTATGTLGVTITIGVTGSVFGSTNLRAIKSVGDRTVVANNGQLTGGETVVLSGNDSQVLNTASSRPQHPVCGSK
jgi:hypothetical protein